MSSLPSKEEIHAAFAAGKVPVGRQLLWQALQYGLASEANSTSVASMLSELLFHQTDNEADTDVLNIEEHVVDAFWLSSSSLVDDDDNKNTSAKEAPKQEGDAATGTPLMNGGGNTSKQSRDALASMLKALLGDGEEEDAAISTKKLALKVQLQSQLDPPLLEKAGLVASEKELMKKLRMLNTKNYRQHKFNLLQEESEGFSKVLEALIKHDFSSLKVIIGTFHVDPNRILDLALDVIIEEHNSPHKKKEMELEWLKDFSTEKIPPLMAFKLRNTADSAPNTQRILQTIAYLCIQEPSILPLDKMSAYLEPITMMLGQTFPLFSQIERKRVRSVGKVSLGGSSASKKKEEERDAQNQAKLEGLLKQLEQTHRIQLLNMLLKERQWNLVQVLFSDREELKQIITLFQPLGSAVCDWIHAELEPLCEKYVSTPPDLMKSASSTLVKKKQETDVTDIPNASPEATAESVVEMVSSPLLCILDSGCIVARPTLYCQLCRLLRALLTRDHGGPVEEGTLSPSTTLYSFIESFLLPSLSLFPANPSLSLEVWSLLKLFPYTTRYQLYRDWRGVGLERAGLQMFGDKNKPLVLVESEMHAGKDARYVLKRLSKDTIREACRQVAKVTHSNPLVMFTTVLNQIESYDNLVSVMVEALQFVTPLGLDVLGFCMLSRLCGSTSTDGDRSRSTGGGINVALWLQSMESFIGSFYERYPFVEFRGIVCYVMRRLRYGHVTELGVLRSLLKTTGGWSFADYSPAASLSLTQLEGRAGSTLLKRETMTFGVVDKINLRSSQRLRYVLQSEDIGVSLLILLAQVRSRIVFDSGGGRPKPVKLIGSLYDTTQVVMATLLDFMTKSSELAQSTGGIKKSEGGTGDEPSSKDERKPEAEIIQFATSMPKLTDLVKTYGIDIATAWMLCRPLVRASEKKEYANASNASAVLDFSMTEATRGAYKPLVRNEATWNDISQEFFEMFYIHTLYDLFCPETIYNTEINRVTKEVERLEQRKQQGGAPHSLQPGSVGGGPQQNPDEAIDRLKRVSSTLSSQIGEQKERVALIHKSMKDAAGSFFLKKDVSVSAVNTFLSECVFPRSMQGPDDAMYCAQFVSLLHKGETPGFSTLHYLDELISVLSSSLFGVTEGEAANLSILFLETWKMVCRWRYDENAFDEEVAGKPGSYMVDPVGEGGTTSEGNLYSVSFEQYRLRFEKWHMAIGAAALGCLQSSEYIHTRASLIVLSRIVEVFPTRPNLGNKLFEVLEPLKSESNSFPDIRSAAQAYFMQLTKARADGVWKEEDAAVVQARIKAEKEAQELRKRKAEELFDDMKMESEKINAEIGGDDRGGRDRFGGGRDRRGGRPSDARDYGRGGPDGRRSPAINPNVPNFEPPPRRTATAATEPASRGDRRPGAPPHDHGRGREPLDRRRDADTRVGRDSAPLLGSLGRADTHAAPARTTARGADPAPRNSGRNNDDDHRNLDGRWEGSRNPGPSRGGRAKRGRSASPDGDRGESRGGRDAHQPSKRSRTDQGGDRSPGDHRSGGGGRRRR